MNIAGVQACKLLEFEGEVHLIQLNFVNPLTFAGIDIRIGGWDS